MTARLPTKSMTILMSSERPVRAAREFVRFDFLLSRLAVCFAVVVRDLRSFLGEPGCAHGELLNSSSSAFASFRSAVSKPSVNQL
jgi:hypothetical protein